MILNALVLCLVSLVRFAGQATSPRDIGPSVDVLIPQGMPIKMDVQRDQRMPEIVKYIIRRLVPKNANRASIIAVLVDKDGIIKLVDPMVGNHLTDPMTIATADKSIARILLIVEWLEVNNGKWIVDSKAHELDIESLVKRGAKALPCAKFIELK